LDMSEQNTTSAMTIEIDPTKIGSATILPFWCGFYYPKKNGIHQQPPKVLGKWNQEKLVHDFEAAIPLSLVPLQLHDFARVCHHQILSQYLRYLGLSWNFVKRGVGHVGTVADVGVKLRLLRHSKSTLHEMMPLASNTMP
jgi:hypothetical protein